jgi:hypothetical protein
MKTNTFKRTSNQKAQGMVEFALVLPIVLLLVFGVIEFGRLLFIYSAVTTASREAVRYGSAVDDASGTYQFADCVGIEAAARRVGSLVGLDSVTITYDNLLSNPDGTACSSSFDTEQVVGGDSRILVEVSASYQPLVPLVNIPPFPITSDSVRTIVKDIELAEDGAPGGGGGGGGAGGGGSSCDPSVATVDFSADQVVSEDAGTLTVTINVTGTAKDIIEIPYSVGGSAVNPADHNLVDDTVTIPQGASSSAITFDIVDDMVDEFDETVLLTMGTVSCAQKGDSAHEVTIEDNDPLPFVRFSSASQTGVEGDNFTFIIELVDASGVSTTSGKAVDVDYSMTGSASYPDDHNLFGGAVIIPSGDTSESVSIDTVDDALDEDAENIIVTIVDPPSNAIRHNTDYQHTVTITDNDDPPQLSFSTPPSPPTAIVTEGGTSNLSIWLDVESGKDIEVNLSPSGGTATQDVDYQIPNSVTIPAGQRSADILFEALQDDQAEGDETVDITLDSVVDGNATIVYPDTNEVTITETLLEPTVFFTNATQVDVMEGNSTSIGVKLTNQWSDPVTVRFEISGDKITGSDYTMDTTLTFNPGETSKQIFPVDFLADNLYEGSEEFIVTIAEVTSANASIDQANDTHALTIMDGDSPPKVEFDSAILTGSEADLSLSPENPRYVDPSVIVVLDKASSLPVTVSIDVTLGSGLLDGDDFTVDPTVLDLETNGITIPAGSKYSRIVITVTDDVIDENDETLTLEITAIEDATPGANQSYTLTIEDDDLPSCDVETELLTVSTNYVTWDIQNNGEQVVLDQVEITWPESSRNKPRLDKMHFAGYTFWDGNQAPSYLQVTVLDPDVPPLPQTSIESLEFQFGNNQVLGSGTHKLEARFVNGTETCSAVEQFEN